MSWFGSVRLLSIEGRLAAAPLLIGWAWWDGGGRVASRRGVVSTRRRVLLCMLAFIYKFVKWGAARHKRHKQSRRTRGKACCYIVCPFVYICTVSDLQRGCLQRTDSSVLRGGRKVASPPSRVFQFFVRRLFDCCIHTLGLGENCTVP